MDMEEAHEYADMAQDLAKGKNPLAASDTKKVVRPKSNV